MDAAGLGLAVLLSWNLEQARLKGFRRRAWATGMVEMSGLKRAFMGLRAAIGNFKVSGGSCGGLRL
jgi:hypothetical protein